jgi:hypothetical protein
MLLLGGASFLAKGLSKEAWATTNRHQSWRNSHFITFPSPEELTIKGEVKTQLAMWHKIKNIR